MTGRSSAIGGGSRGDRGYTLVAVIVAVTVLNVLLAVALPLWSQRIQRQKEEELIARGLQYAQAIQVFQTRFGRLPVRLEELIEVKPRSIRQLWKDPMTEDGKWGLIFQGANGAPVTPPNPNDRGRQGGRSAPGTLAQGTSPGLERGRKGDRVTIGPISGVYSLSTEESILTFNDAKQHSEWKFDTQLLVSTVSVGSTQQAGAPPGAATVLPARWIGRPFRKGITVQRQRPNQQIPPGSGPGGTTQGEEGRGGNQQQQNGPFGVGGVNRGQGATGNQNRGANIGQPRGGQPRDRGSGRRPGGGRRP